MSKISAALSLVKRLRTPGGKPYSLKLRLFAFFSFFVAAVVLLILLVLLTFGVFKSGEKQSAVWMTNELQHLSQDISYNLGILSVRGVHMAEEISLSLSSFMEERGLIGVSLKSHPELLEGLLAAQMETIKTNLTNNVCSGAFIILDATVNPDAEGSEYMKAGLFLKRTDPNTIDLMGTKTHFLRGPASIARENGIGLLGQWQMEFDVSDEDFWQITMRGAQKNPELSLDRQYYWSRRVTLKNNSESVILLCIPIAADGRVYGICGFEISSMLFKNAYSPDNSEYSHIFLSFAPSAVGGFDMDAGLIAGNSYLTNSVTGRVVSIYKESDRFFFYKTEENAVYGGLENAVGMYPTGSLYSDESWCAALIMPGSDLSRAIRGYNLPLYIALLLLLVIGIIGAALISGRFIRPVIKALDSLRENEPAGLKSNYLEINDLFEYLAERDRAREAEAEIKKTPDERRKNVSDPPNMDAYNAFITNISMLSPAESAVFELYTKGYTAREITEILHLSINTIKTHNKRIFMKLNVESRRELMVYVGMMKKTEEV